MEDYLKKGYIFIYKPSENDESHDSPWLNNIEKNARSYIDSSKAVCFFGLEGTSKTTLAFNIKKYYNRPLLKVCPDILHEPRYLREGVIRILSRIKTEISLDPILFVDEIDMIVPEKVPDDHIYDYDLLKSTMKKLFDPAVNDLIFAKIATTNNPKKIDQKIGRLIRRGSIYCPIPNFNDRLDMINYFLTGTINLTKDEAAQLAKRSVYTDHSNFIGFLEDVKRNKMSTIKQILNYLEMENIKIPQEHIIYWGEENKEYLEEVDYPCTPPE